MKPYTHRLTVARRLGIGAVVLTAAACATTPDPDADVSTQGGATATTPAVGGTATTVAAGGSTTGGAASGGGTVGSGGATGTTDATGTPTSGNPSTGNAGTSGTGATGSSDPTGSASGRNLSAGGAAQGAPVSPDEMFTDARIAAVASASNQDEIQTSQVAVQQAQDAQVKAYAQRMIDEHSRFEQQQQQLLQQKGLAPQDNALSLQLTRNLQPTLDSLRAKSGREFDMAYVLHQVSSHETTLKTLDTSLIPQARDAEMKAMLQRQVRPAVAEHLAEAKRLHHAMAQQK